MLERKLEEEDGQNDFVLAILENAFIRQTEWQKRKSSKSLSAAQLIKPRDLKKGEREPLFIFQEIG